MRVSCSPCSVSPALSFVFSSLSATFGSRLGLRGSKKRCNSCKEISGQIGRVGREKGGVLKTGWSLAHVWVCLGLLGALGARDCQGHPANQARDSEAHRETRDKRGIVGEREWLDRTDRGLVCLLSQGWRAVSSMQR